MPSSQARLASLYSDFSSRRSINPESYAANSAAWLGALNAASLAGLVPNDKSDSAHSCIELNYNQKLIEAFRHPQFGTPSALGTVIQDAVSQKTYIPLQEFKNAKKSIYARAWIPTPWQVVSWGLSRVGLIGTDASSHIANASFVSIANLELVAKVVSTHISHSSTSYVRRLWTRADFEQEISDVVALHLEKASPSTPVSLSDADKSILLTHLSRDKPILTFNSTTVKAHDPSIPTKPDTITSEDTSVANLRHLITSLQTSISLTTHEIDSQSRALTMCIKENRSPILAKTALRAKKAAEAKLSKTSSMLDRLQETYTAIEQAADNVTMLSALRESASVLKVLNQQVGSVESVQQVTDRLTDQMADVKDLTDALHTNGDMVDDELRQLEAEAKAASKEKLEIASSSSAVVPDASKHTQAAAKVNQIAEGNGSANHIPTVNARHDANEVNLDNERQGQHEQSKDIDVGENQSKGVPTSQPAAQTERKVSATSDMIATLQNLDIPSHQPKIADDRDAEYTERIRAD